MKIINARTGNLQHIPFALGESGRARCLIPVDIDQRHPVNAEDVGYVVVPNSSIILTQPRPEQRGTLVRIDTRGCYTRGTTGWASLKGGEATCIASGTYAFGDAGGIGSGSDELWHVTSEDALWTVYLSGGSYKGYGRRYCILTRTGKVHMLDRANLCQLIATDNDPEIVAVVRKYADALHEDVQAAIKLADELDEFEPSDSSVSHFIEGGDISQLTEKFGIEIPVSLQPLTGGISGVQSGVLVPGDKSLVMFHAGPGGGKRYGWTSFHHGLSILKEVAGGKGTSSDILALVEQEDWYYGWENRKDGEVTSYELVNAQGFHFYSAYPDPYDRYAQHGRDWNGTPIESPEWENVAALFGVQIVQDAEVQADENYDDGGDPLARLQALNAKRLH